MTTTTFYFPAEEKSVCIREKYVISQVTILILAFCNTGRDFHMAKTEVPDTPKDGQTEV